MRRVAVTAFLKMNGTVRNAQERPLNPIFIR